MSEKISSAIRSIASRPLANFHPNHWTDHVLNIPLHDEKTYSHKEKEIKSLKDEAEKMLLETKTKPLEDQLNFIDTLERLGVAYHFENEIEQALHGVYSTQNDENDLYHTSLRFRILRQHGFPVPCDVFNKFKDHGKGTFKVSSNDVEGVLSLYEACHVRVHGEDILDEALSFTTSFLAALNVDKLSSESLKERLSYALRHPLQKGMPRLMARHHIVFVYEKEPSHNNILLKFAKLDFNFVQSLHKKELKDFTKWWKNLHANVLYSRDRFAEAYFWIVGTFYEPQYMFARKIFRKIFKVTSLMDDTYDAYGTLDELERLNEAIQSWDKSYTNKLPEHVKLSYKALLEVFEDVEQELAKEGRSSFVHYAINQMKVLSQAYIQEARWCHQKYVPTYDDYMKVALITSPYPYGTVASFLGMGEIASKEVFEWLCQNPMPKPVRAASTIIRLLNDLYGHEIERGRNHVASAVECYMERHGFEKKEDVKKELLKQVEDAWKDINQAMLQPYAIPKPLLTRILNLARSANVIYEGEDGYTVVSPLMKEKVADVLLNPIPV